MSNTAKKHIRLLKPPTITNKRASFEYSLLDKYVAGLALTGTEIKSIRGGKVNIQQAYCVFAHQELFVRDMHIGHYAFGNLHNHNETRVRKLLLHRRELDKLMKSKQKGLTIIPIQLFVNPAGLAKLEIALARGKKLYDKRQSIKEKDLQREAARQYRHRALG
ncbi:MAG: SsrA-binding protein SmpB [Bacteroidota bacterium]